MFIERAKLSEIKKRLEYFPVVGIIGPRQVGKTTIAKQLIPLVNKETIYLDLESLSDYQKLENPELYLEQHENKCVIIDEIQNKAELFPLLRSLIDKYRTPGRFIILGSASPALLRQSSESLAGRISYIELKPLLLNELKNSVPLNQHWFRGGFPQALLLKEATMSSQWLQDFINSYAERDLPGLGFPSNPMLIKRLWTMLAYLNGQIINYSNLARSLQLSSPTLKTYVDFFENSFLINRLQPFYLNIKKRTIKSPKLYLTDTGILHKLLSIDSLEDLYAHPGIGNSWESYVINQISGLKEPNIELSFYRTKDGSELDLIFTKSMKIVACAEIKFTSSPSLSSGNTIAVKTLESKVNFIITPQSEDFLIRENVRVCSLNDFLLSYLPGL
ncbi:MAG: ATP-binding protein [Bacteroidales bacterium]|nr:ATP-binding protein [Bacteroidales bacterium]MCF8403314.1 ATP-binding protein [Bacteroidales bacterium]